MARIDGEIMINRPVEEVFDFVADERNEPRYNPRMVRAEMLSQHRGVGSGGRAPATFADGAAGQASARGAVKAPLMAFKSWGLGRRHGTPLRNRTSDSRA